VLAQIKYKLSQRGGALTKKKHIHNYNRKMSKNNLILVAYCVYRKAYYVIPNANADTDWSPRGAAKIKNKKCIRDRGRALMLAHDIDRKMKTEYGVREVTIRRKDREKASCDFVFI